MKPKKIKNSQSGFTFVELVVALFIMATLSAIMVAGFNQGTKSRAVTLGGDVVSNSIRTAQNQSQNPQVIPNAISPCAPPDNVPSEFHIKFDTTTTILNYSFFEYAKCENPPSTPIILQNFGLPRNVQLRKADGLLVDGVSLGNDGGTLEIKFLPPFGKLSVSKNGGQFVNFTQAKVIVETPDGAFMKTITLDGLSGRVDVQ
jgi:prepilin-type N-terminal cleavage/methylation domain-containing protein